MLLVRRVAAVLSGVYMTLWVPGVLARLFDPPAVVLYPLAAVAVGLGAVAGFREGRRLEPHERQEHRDAVIGWGIVLGIIGVLVAFVLPLPWAVVAALGWIVVAAIVARRCSVGVTAPPVTVPDARGPARA